MEKNKKEIDLIELILKIYLYLRKYFWILLLSVIIGIAFSVIRSKRQKPVYSSSMVIITKSDNNFNYAFTLKEFQERFQKNPGEIIVKIINSANNLRSNGNIKELAKRMDISEENISSISSLSAEHIYVKGESMSNIVTINVSSSSDKVFEELSTGIMNYINNNTYIKNNYSSDSLSLVNIISKVDEKINELDSLQDLFLKRGHVSDIFVYKEKSFFMENVMLTSLKEKLQNELSHLKKAEIIEDFFIPKQQSISNIKSMVVSIIIMLILGFILIAFIILNKKANQYKKSRLS